MNRRAVLATLGGGLLTGLAGCNDLSRVADSSSTPTPPTDSDLDGTVDEDDYAPWDSSVQAKEDVLDEYWGRVLSSDADSATPVETLFSRSSPQAARTISLTPGGDVPESESAFREYSVSGASLHLNADDRPETPHQVLVVARLFPRRRVVASARSGRLNGTDDIHVDVSFPEPLTSSETIYLSAFVTPDVPLSDLEVNTVAYLHETNPFHVSSGVIEPTTTDYELDAVSDTHYSRIPVAGGYAIFLSGRTNGDDWSISYLVSRSAYERKRMEPRGRRREEYARYALSNGSGDQFSDIIQQAAEDAGFTSRTEQAEFAIDMVQSLPYILDSVGSGYDDYTKFVEETFTDLQGDCEDTTVALGVVLSNLGFDVVTVEFPGHIGVGIAGNYDGSYVQYDGVQYYYVETTGEGWGIGTIPENLNTSEVKIRAI